MKMEQTDGADGHRSLCNSEGQLAELSSFNLGSGTWIGPLHRLAYFFPSSARLLLSCAGRLPGGDRGIDRELARLCSTCSAWAGTQQGWRPLSTPTKDTSVVYQDHSPSYYLLRIQEAMARSAAFREALRLVRPRGFHARGNIPYFHTV